MKKMIMVLMMFATTPAMANCYWDEFTSFFSEPNTLAELEYSRQCTAELCDSRILDLTANVYVLENAEKQYYAQVNRAKLNDTVRKCRHKINRLDKKIEALKKKN